MGKMGICGEMAVNYEGPMALSALVLPAMRRLHDNSHWTTKDSRLEDEQGADDQDGRSAPCSEWTMRRAASRDD